MDGKFSITKSTVEQYKIRHTSRMYWADIVLDSGNECGRLQIASDYGSWQNYWSSCGCSFKKFLPKIDMQYFAEKVGENDWFDIDATRARIYQDIKCARKDREIGAKEGKEICEEVKRVFSSVGCRMDYEHFIFDSKIIWNFYQEPCSIPLETDVSPQFKRFYNEAWQCFIEQLKQEII
ncbi:MAG: hypothetical protein RR397_11270 [Odoribacter sp.]